MLAASSTLPAASFTMYLACTQSNGVAAPAGGAAASGVAPAPKPDAGCGVPDAPAGGVTAAGAATGGAPAGAPLAPPSAAAASRYLNRLLNMVRSPVCEMDLIRYWVLRLQCPVSG